MRLQHTSVSVRNKGRRRGKLPQEYRLLHEQGINGKPLPKPAVRKMRKFPHGTVELMIGDIVAQETDAIVNAANTKLAGGGGVDGAIHRAAGPELEALFLQFPADERGRRCQTGQVKTTSAGNLPIKWVIHAVGPFYNERYSEKARAQLGELHTLALREAISHSCKSIDFPAISTGAYRFPVTEAAEVAIVSVCRFLVENSGLELVRFVLFGKAHLATAST